MYNVDTNIIEYDYNGTLTDNKITVVIPPSLHKCMVSMKIYYENIDVRKTVMILGGTTLLSKWHQSGTNILPTKLFPMHAITLHELTFKLECDSECDIGKQFCVHMEVEYIEPYGDLLSELYIYWDEPSCERYYDDQLILVFRDGMAYTTRYTYMQDIYMLINPDDYIWTIDDNINIEI